MVNWAEQIGPHTAKLFERILAEKPHPEMGLPIRLGSSDWPRSIPDQMEVPTSHTNRCLPLPEREIDPEELADQQLPQNRHFRYLFPPSATTFVALSTSSRRGRLCCNNR